jgi:DNA-directed RNA polymerases I, II, and III subunit RPABC5
MIGPVACFTCGKRLGAYWETYYTLTNQYKNSTQEDSFISLNAGNIKVTPEAKALDELKITKICCRRMMLGNVDLLDKL